MKIHPTILNVLSEVSRLPAAEHIVVFGSLARMENNPCDLDVALMLPECPSWGEALSDPGTKKTIHALIRLARANYGYFDPFVVTQQEMMVRNAHATGWTLSKAAGALKANILRDGRPVQDLAEILILSESPEDAPIPGM